MKGDFSRTTFNKKAHYSRVLLQQGRVTLDADVNEEASIVLHYLQTLARDLFGPYGGPVDGGFGLFLDASKQTWRLGVGAGHYYVDGILCENETAIDYLDQPDYPLPQPNSQGTGGDPLASWLKNHDDNESFWVYLDAWERHITWIEDDRIREVALGGPDTSTRSKVVWQVKAMPWNVDGAADPACEDPLSTLQPIGDATMGARLDPGSGNSDPCVLPPDALYRGAENQLYRVEIHVGGTVGGDPVPTFKWSRDNGSIATRWLGTEGNDLLVRNARGFAAGIWLELSDDVHDLSAIPGTLVKLTQVEGDRLTVDPASVDDPSALAWSEQLSNPKVRRWDQHANDDTVLVAGAVPVTEGTEAKDWIDLEDGIQIRFNPGGVYRSGDYWMITARVATGGIDWPFGADEFVPPLGIEHHYAPLGFVLPGENHIQDCRTCEGLGILDCQVPIAPPDNLAEPAAAKPAAAARRQEATPKSVSARRVSRIPKPK